MKYCTHWLRISSEFFLKNILRLMFSQRGLLERKFPLIVICYPISFLIKNAHLTIGILQRLKFLLSRRFKYILLSNLHCGETEKHRQFNELTSMWNLKQTKTKKYPPPHQKKKKKQLTNTENRLVIGRGREWEWSLNGWWVLKGTNSQL